MTTGGFHEGPFIILDCVCSCAPGRIRAHWNNLELALTQCNYQLCARAMKNAHDIAFDLQKTLIEVLLDSEKVNVNPLVGVGHF